MMRVMQSCIRILAALMLAGLASPAVGQRIPLGDDTKLSWQTTSKAYNHRCNGGT